MQWSQYCNGLNNYFNINLDFDDVVITVYTVKADNSNGYLGVRFEKPLSARSFPAATPPDQTFNYYHGNDFDMTVYYRLFTDAAGGTESPLCTKNLS